MSLKQLQQDAAIYGLNVDSYQGRYKFSHSETSYFAMDNSMRANSHKEAQAFLDGYAQAHYHFTNKNEG